MAEDKLMRCTVEEPVASVKQRDTDCHKYMCSIKKRGGNLLVYIQLNIYYKFGTTLL